MKPWRSGASVCVLVAIAVTVTTSSVRLASANESIRSIEVFLLDGMSVKNETSYPKGIVRVFYLDGVHRLEAMLGDGLPGDEARAHAIAAERIASMSNETKLSLGNAWLALRRGAYYGLEKVPAVVINETAVVYGLSDIAQVRKVWDRAH